MTAEKKYTVGYSRLAKSFRQNFECREDKTIVRKNAKKGARILVNAIDSGSTYSEWGRLHFKVKKSSTVVYRVHVFALNSKEFLRNGIETYVEDFMADSSVEDDIKYEFMEHIKAVVSVCKNDCVLYSLSGRYLWIYMEVWGEGEFECSDMEADAVGDNFMAAFPAVYQERNSFFHRYMSVFSSIYNDFQDKINHMDKLLDVDFAPVELLEEYAEWFGIDIRGGFLSEDKMRTFMKQIFDLVKHKGTKECLERVTKMALGSSAVIIERGLMENEEERENMRVYDELYGDSPYDVLVLTTVAMEEQKKAQLIYFLEQFKPVRCNMNVVFLKEHGELDRYTYLGMNAKLTDTSTGVMDGNMEIDEMTVMV
jgi:phage tail-like protein